MLFGFGGGSKVKRPEYEIGDLIQYIPVSRHQIRKMGIVYDINDLSQVDRGRYWYDVVWIETNLTQTVSADQIMLIMKIIR
jgi:hypothetical protein